MVVQTHTAVEVHGCGFAPGLRLVVEVVTLNTGRLAYLVTRRGDLAVVYDAANMADAQRYIATGQRR